jgi:hypothetical protein
MEEQPKKRKTEEPWDGNTEKEEEPGLDGNKMRCDRGVASDPLSV